MCLTHKNEDRHKTNCTHGLLNISHTTWHFEKIDHIEKIDYTTTTPTTQNVSGTIVCMVDKIGTQHKIATETRKT